MEAPHLDRLVGVAKYAFKGLSTAVLLAMVPRTAEATGHGTITLIFAGLAIFVIWGSK
jgi:hypothetical protein